MALLLLMSVCLSCSSRVLSRLVIAPGCGRENRPGLPCVGPANQPAQAVQCRMCTGPLEHGEAQGCAHAKNFNSAPAVIPVLSRFFGARGKIFILLR